MLDNYIKNGNAFDERQGVTYILLSNDETKIMGYYSIEVSRIDQVEDFGDTKYYIPMGGTININCLALHIDFQKKKLKLPNGETRYISDYLLRHCEKRILEISKQVGVTFITLFSTERGYYLYHNRNEYEDFEDDMSILAKESDVSCRKLYKWIEDIKV